jgi:LPS-assembly protein
VACAFLPLANAVPPASPPTISANRLTLDIRPGLCGAALILLGVVLWLFSAARVVAQTPQSGAFSLKLDGALSETAVVPETLPAFGRAWIIEGRTEDETTLIGDAEVRRAGSVIRGDRITYYPADNEVVAVGNVRVTRDGNVFTGPSLQLRIDTNEGSFTSPDYYLALQGGGRGHAERIDFLGPGRTMLFRGTYSTCGPEAPDWEISSRTLLLDQNEGEGVGRGSVLEWRGKPVLATPYLTFALGNVRKTGWLTPTFGINSRSGADLMVPWYWNIAHNVDATLYPRISTRRGPQLGGEFRYLQQTFMGETRFEANPHDPVSNSSRYFWHTRHSFSNFGGWGGGWDMRGVSDDRYFVDYSRNIITSADRVLPRAVSVGRGLSEDWSMSVSVQKFQSILDARPGPYDREPQVVARWMARDRYGFDMNGVFDFTQFRAPDAVRVSGVRGVANPQVSWPIRYPGWFVIPKAAVHSSTYQLTDPTGLDSSLQRTVPYWSLDSGLVFERSLNLAGRELTQTLEPRLFYVKAPYRDQANFPVFDTAPADFNFAQLFSENSFIGNDRIADVNQLTVAAISRFINPTTGTEGVRFATGFRSYFSDQAVSIPGLAPRTDRRSDLLFAAAGPIGPDWSVDSGLQYSTATSMVPRASLSVRYLPADGRILNASVRYRREQLGQLDVSTRWPVAAGWNALARANYSFLEQGVDPISRLPNTRGVVEALAGFEYRASCWAARVVTQRFRTAADASTTAFFFQLELNGVGGIGQNPFTILQRNIPGYRLPQGLGEPGSRYFGYE